MVSAVPRPGDFSTPCAIGLALLLAAWLPAGEAASQAITQSADEMVVEIEERVRQIYFEGFPFEAARHLSPAAVERLGEMLDSPEERPYWSNIVLALGYSGSPLGYAPLAAFAARKPQGEVNAALYQAHVALPIALGHLARDNSAAMQLLEQMARAANTGADPGWSFRSQRGAQLSENLRRGAITGLAVSGLPEVEAVFSELENARQAEPDPEGERARHFQSARALRARVGREGPDRVFGHPRARRLNSK